MKNKIFIGTNLLNKKPFFIDLNELINPHILIFGISGSGKTHFIKYIMEEIIKKYPIENIKIIDGQGDIVTPNTYTVSFTETGQYGINPLKLSDDPIYGGVRKKISNFINAINKTEKKLGNRQEAVLRNLLLDLYAKNGFFADNPSTWKLEKEGKWRKSYPTASDLLRFTYSKIFNKKFGLDRKSVKKFEELEKLNKQRYKLLIDKTKLEHNQSKLNDSQNQLLKAELKNIENKINSLKEEMKKVCAEAIDYSNGSEIEDLIKYQDANILLSVYDTLNNLFSKGFFKDKEPNFKGKLHRYDIKSLEIDEQKLFAEFLAQDLFNKARETGLKEEIFQYLIVDEARKFTNAKSKKDDALKLIARESRKYGLGAVFATQQVEHLPDDILQNCSIKIILGVNEQVVSKVAKTLMIKEEHLSAIQLRKTALINVKTKNNSSNFYYPILLYK